MLLELCKSAVHIMFSDMCPVERERERKRERPGEKMGRGWKGEVMPGTEGERRMGGGWDLGLGEEGRVVEGSRAAAAQVLHHGEKRWAGLVPPPSPCHPLQFQPFTLSPHPRQHDLAGHLSSMSSSVKWEWPKGLTTHGWVQDSSHSLVL